MFFSWLDEFFIKFTGDDSFIPQDQTQKPASASKWSVPPSVKTAVASMVGEKGQGPPVSTVRPHLCLRNHYILYTAATRRNVVEAQCTRPCPFPSTCDIRYCGFDGYHQGDH